MDIAALRRHYESLSDEALFEIDRDELVEEARVVLDEELAQRNLEEGPVDDGADEGMPNPRDLDAGDDWLSDAVVIFSGSADHRRNESPEVERVCEALEAAQIPHDVDVREGESAEETRFDVLVPGKLVLEAGSILDRDVFNATLEAEWRTHFEVMSDEELRALHLPTLVAGWQDRIERLTRAYKEEIARRG